jgi:hypothetical protein
MRRIPLFYTTAPVVRMKHRATGACSLRWQAMEQVIDFK